MWSGWIRGLGELWSTDGGCGELLSRESSKLLSGGSGELSSRVRGAELQSGGQLLRQVSEIKSTGDISNHAYCHQLCLNNTGRWAKRVSLTGSPEKLTKAQ